MISVCSLNILRRPLHLGTIPRHQHFLGGKAGVLNLPTDSSKKLQSEGGRSQKSWKFANVLDGWSLMLASFSQGWPKTKWPCDQNFFESVNYHAIWTLTEKYGKTSKWKISTSITNLEKEKRYTEVIMVLKKRSFAWLVHISIPPIAVSRFTVPTWDNFMFIQFKIQIFKCDELASHF